MRRTLPVSAACAFVGGLPERGDAEIAAVTEARINDRIRAREVLLIGENGEQLGVRPLPQALQAARDHDLDLVEVAPNANPPVCGIMDYRRYQYEQQQKRKESRKRATNVVIKEMKFRPKISGHDYETKMKNVERFLADGNKVKLTIMFRGREMAHPELGLKILNRIAEQVAVLLARNPAAHASLDDSFAVAGLLDELRRARADAQVAVLVARNPAAHASFNNPAAVGRLLHALRVAGENGQAAMLMARNPAAHVPLDSPFAVGILLDSLREAEENDQVEILAERAAAGAPLENPSAVAHLLGTLRRAGEAHSTPWTSRKSRWP